MQWETRKLPWGYKWRSSRWLIGASITVALFSETFLYSFPVPILGYMLEDRLHFDPSSTQPLTSALLAVHGFFNLIAAPVIAHFSDKTPHRKAALLVALGGSIAGTLMVAVAPSLVMLFVGRIVQAIAGSGAWVIGLALLTGNVPEEHLGKTLGTASAFISGGTLTGPVVGGTLLQLSGYWAAWSFPLALLVVDVIARLIMIEPLDSTPPWRSLSQDNPKPVTHHHCVQETSPLLPDSEPLTKSPPVGGFYRIVLTDKRVIIGLSCMSLNSALITSINCTLPVHLRTIFNWGSMPTGMALLCWQVPSIILGPFVGWVLDRYGLKQPTTIGLLLCAPFFILLSVPGHEYFPWAGGDAAGKPLLVGCITCLGITSMFIRGAGPVQMLRVTNELQAKYPKIFGAHGGSSRVLSITEIGYSLGTVIGPLLSGVLYKAVGFPFINIFAVAYLVLAIPSYLWLDGWGPS